MICNNPRSTFFQTLLLDQFQLALQQSWKLKRAQRRKKGKKERKKGAFGLTEYEMDRKWQMMPDIQYFETVLRFGVRTERMLPFMYKIVSWSLFMTGLSSPRYSLFFTVFLYFLSDLCDGWKAIWNPFQPDAVPVPEIAFESFDVWSHL